MPKVSEPSWTPISEDLQLVADRVLQFMEHANVSRIFVQDVCGLSKVQLGQFLSGSHRSANVAIRLVEKLPIDLTWEKARVFDPTEERGE